MRVLLLSANTGEGHNSCGKALMEVMKAQGISCEMRDALASVSPRFSKFICNWHVRLYRYGGKLFDMGYRVMERNPASPDETTMLFRLMAKGADRLKEGMEGFDAVISVHPFTSMMLTAVRRKYGLDVPCYFVSTDYACAPTVEQCDADRYFTPAEALAEEFVQVGLPRERLFASGIPVRQAFYGREDRTEARRKLGLPEDKILVLLMCGSMGAGGIRKVAKALVDRLSEGAAVVAICGTNEKLFDALSELADPRLRVVGYTREFPLYLDAVDLVVTKPGGLSTSETANKHVPMVLFNTIGGCESRNFTYFLSRGYAVGSKDPEEVVTLAAKLAADPESRQRLRQALEAGFCTNSARMIVEMLREDVPG